MLVQKRISRFDHWSRVCACKSQQSKGKNNARLSQKFSFIVLRIKHDFCLVSISHQELVDSSPPSLSAVHFYLFPSRSTSLSLSPLNGEAASVGPKRGAKPGDRIIITSGRVMPEITLYSDARPGFSRRLTGGARRRWRRRR